jgi:HK97 family phage major capsid protein
VERQLLRGSAGGDEVQGLLTSRGVPVFTAGTALGSVAEQLFKAANSMRGSAFVEPDWIVVSPTDYEKLRLGKDNSGQFYAGGPFSGSYGVGQGGAASPQITGSPDLLWGKPTYVTPLIGSGTALIGTRSGAQVWSRGGLTVEASTSHDQHFVKDLVAIRAERRLALTVYRNSAYVEVRGLA